MAAPVRASVRVWIAAPIFRTALYTDARTRGWAHAPSHSSVRYHVRSADRVIHSVHHSPVTCAW